MTREEACKNILEAISAFEIEGNVLSYNSYGNGHINDTFLLVTKEPNGELYRYILQRMNHEIFKEPHEVIANIDGVTSFLRNKIIENGGDVDRETLNLIPLKVIKSLSEKFLFKDSIGSYWRMYKFIPRATCYDLAKNSGDFYQSGLAFGHFQSMLSDYPADTLYETIKDFHNTKVRFQNLKRAIERDSYNRAIDAKREIDFALSNSDIANKLMDMLERGELPLRVTHNDTKLNNIMIDNDTKKAICIIDLDTVMPGLSVNDFGDSIRFGASTAKEDERNLEKVNCNMDLFESYTKGFIEGCDNKLTRKEIRALPIGAVTMTYECGIRFLTDYLEGDIYFKIHREKHNLDRCRTQFKLVQDMKNKWSQMTQIVNKFI